MASAADLVLVTGATGYIGGLLVPRLLARGHRVRCLVRNRAGLERYEWSSHVEIAEGDLLQIDTLAPAFHGVSALYYLVHSMGAALSETRPTRTGAPLSAALPARTPVRLPPPGFAQRDRQAASNAALVAQEEKVGRIIYLGGLGDESPDLSEHLASRHEVGGILAGGKVPVTEFRAAVIVGARSVSFRIVRYLAERLPIMITPRWVHTRIQPIAEDDVLQYLVAALDHPESSSKMIEIGGRDILTYGEMMLVYARIRGLRRRLIPVPVLTPSLSSLWVGLVTPIPSAIARPLIEGLKTETVVKSPLARRLFPIDPIGYEEAVLRVLLEDPGLR
jgi:uncharacterized protein YbjT (DUF2867 family)